MGIKSRGKAGAAEEEEGGNDFDGEEEVGGAGEDDESGGAGSVSEVIFKFLCVLNGPRQGRMGAVYVVPSFLVGKWGGGSVVWEEYSNSKGSGFVIMAAFLSCLFGLGSEPGGEIIIGLWSCSG